MKDPETSDKAYKEAKKRVEKEKGFYTHVAVYIIINIAIFFFKEKMLVTIDPNPNDKGFYNWWNWSNIATPLLWGIGLFFHWLCTFKKTFMFNKKWEERKIKKLMEEDDF